MSVSNADTRKLSFPLQNPETVVGDTPDDGTPLIPFSWQTTDSQEKVIVTLELSLDEYVALASAIDVGRDIAYGSDTNLLWWIWTRSINPMSFCARVIECIESDADTKAALSQYLIDNGYRQEAGNPASPDIYTENPLLIDGSTIVGCDNDNLFGAISQFIEFIDKRLTDLFEILETETNVVERSQIIAEAIPISDSLGVDSVAAAFDQAVEEISEGYAAVFTTELYDEYRCDLFCIGKDTCEMSFQTIADYFNDRIANAPPAGQFAEYIEWLITGDFAGTQIADAAFSIVFSALAYGSSALGMNMERLMQSMVSALNDPNSDWNVLCECGDAWCKVFDFDIDNGGWQSGTRAAGWTASYTDPYWTKSGNPQVTFEFEIPITVGSIITGISVNTEMIRTSGSDSSPGWVWLDHNISTFNEVWRQNSNANTHVRQDYSNQALNYTIAKGKLSLAVNVAGGAHEHRVYSVTLRGTGDNPFGANNCI